MSRRIRALINLGFLLTVLALIAIGWLAYRSIAELVATTEQLGHTQRTIAAIERLGAGVEMAEASQRAYLLTTASGDLASYQSSLAAIQNDLAQIQSLMADAQPQQGALDLLATLLDRHRTLLNQRIALRDTAGLDATISALRDGDGERISRELAALLDTMHDYEQELLNQRAAATRVSAIQTTSIIISGGGISAIMLLLSLGLLNYGFRQRDRAIHRLQIAEAERARWTSEVEQRNSEILQLSALSELLQICQSTEELGRIMEHMGPQLMPGSSGTLALLSPSREMVEPLPSGGPFAGARPFTPSQCWALRRGSIHETSGDPGDLICDHLRDAAPGATICVPLLTHGELLGVMSAAWPSDAGPSMRREARRQMIVAIAEHCALALAGLRLREAMHHQVMRDPLTGLHNRRYLDEALDRLVERARRTEASVAVMMIDLDHFKQINDTFGHAGGDRALQALGELLARRIRSGDIACRYGGEEFVLLLPDASPAAAADRAASLCRVIRELSISLGGQQIGPLTASIGVAAYPDHADTPAQLLAAADRALYQAKAAGRDRVVTHPSLALAHGATP